MTSVDEHIEGIRARGEDRESDGCARHAPEPAGHDTPGGILHVTGASTNGSEEFLPLRDKRADDFCKTCVPRHNMSFNCVEMSLLISVTVSSSCLFSYTFRLRSSFINIFFSVFPAHATFPLRRHGRTSPMPDNLSGVFRVGVGIRPFPRRPSGGAAFRTRPHDSKYPPAEPGALGCEPLKAARRGR